MGFEIGLKPDEVLDTTLDVFNAMVRGYNDRLVDYQSLAAQVGHWSAYFQSKRPKKLSVIINSINKQKKLGRERHTTETKESDIEKFKERESRRRATMNRWEVQNAR